MARTVKRRGWVGIALESTAGVPVTPAKYVPFKEVTIKEMHEPVADDAGAGLRDKQGSNSVVGKKWGAGKMTLNLDPNLAPIVLGMVMGDFGSPVNEGGGVYTHTFARLATNTPKTASITIDRVNDRNLFTYAAINTCEIGFGEGEIATVDADFLSRFPVATASGTLTTTSGTLFTFKNAVIQISDTLTNAVGAAATAVTNLKITINNNCEPIYLSGDNDVNMISQNSFEVTGEIGFVYENTTQRDYFRNLTKRAVICTLTGGGIGQSLFEFVKIRLAKIRVIEWAPEGGLDDILREKISFVGEYSSGDSKTLDLQVRNRTASY